MNSVVALFLAACSSKTGAATDSISGAISGTGDSNPSTATAPCTVGNGIDINDFVSEGSSDGWPLVFNEVYVAPRYVGDTASEEAVGDDWR